MDLLCKEESYRIVGACFEVYKEMGCGFLETVYHECLQLELSRQQIAFQTQKPLLLMYKGQPLKQTYIPDFIVFDKIILEIKAVRELAPEHRAQLHNYLKATSLRLGLLVNFGHHPKLEHERVIV